jgi:uncharacterized membrane protein
MGTARLTAFTDGVIAIIITVMVLELKLPIGASLADLGQLLPGFVAYVLSFLYVAIYWNNHHHLFQLVRRVDGLILWANANLLFWLSLLPVATAWQGRHFLAPVPTLVYGLLLLLCAVAYLLLEQAILRRRHEHASLAEALGTGFKDKASLGFYLASVLVALWVPLLAVAIYGLVALLWLVPDRRIERVMAGGESSGRERAAQDQKTEIAGADAAQDNDETLGIPRLQGRALEGGPAEKSEAIGHHERGVGSGHRGT